MRRLLLATAAATLLVTTTLGGTAHGATTADTYLRALVRQTGQLPATTESKSRVRRLRRSAAHARRVARRAPCSAVRDLNRYRRVLRGIRVPGGRRGERTRRLLLRLGPASLKASQRLLADRRTRRCGGGVRPSTLGDVRSTVLESDTNGMRVRVELPVLRLVAESGGGQSWTKLVLPDTDSPGAPGTPGIPVVSNNFAVPDGATLDIETGNVQSYRLGGVDVYPVQPDPVDQDMPAPDFLAGPFKTPAFTIDRDAYRDRGQVPADPAGGAIMGSARDLVIGNLQVPAAQYDPVTRNLDVIKSVEISVRFVGGQHTFSDELGSPWEHPQRQLALTMLNSNAVRLPIREIIRRCGEEMMVITSPVTRAAADAFASAKRAQGMRTNVFELGSAGVGTTAAEIQTLIRSRLNAFLCIRPSYVTIMGDDDLVPTFPGINGIPSDLQYSMKNDTDELPDIAVGRIIGNDQAAVQTAVDKIVGYENSPPVGPMLTRATIAAQFQDDNADGRENRTFIQFAETVRTGLVLRGVAVDRIYGEHPGDNPQQFNDGTPLPNELKKPTFAWDGDGADVSAAWNEGRFMVIHRDHGWSDGWGTPGFSTSNVQALTNGANLPVVLSINCSSGAYDYDETSFAGESLVKADGGSVGVFGDTRDSPTWHNTQIALGFVDGLLPSILPGEGPALKQRTGNALINGKLRLAGLAPPGTDGNTRNELYLWHYFGDPSMQMRGGGGPLAVFDPARFLASFRRVAGPGPDAPPYQVLVNVPLELNGQPIALLRNGDVIGKAVVEDGTATIPASFGDGSVKPGDLDVAVDPDGGVPVRAPVRDIPAPGPPEPVDTTLSQTCAPDEHPSNQQMVTSGKLEPGLAGASIIVKYTRPDATTFERTATTDSAGNWMHSIEPQAENGGTSSNNSGTWTMQARYAGDSGHKASQATACTTNVVDRS